MVVLGLELVLGVHSFCPLGQRAYKCIIQTITSTKVGPPTTFFWGGLLYFQKNNRMLNHAEVYLCA